MGCSVPMCRAKHLPLLKVKAATIGSPSARLMMVGQVHHVRKKLVWNQGITKNKETSWSYPSIWFSSCWPYHNLLLWRQPASICQSYPPVQLPRMMRFSSFICMFLKLLYSLVLWVSFVTLSLSMTLILSCPTSSQINRSTLGELSTLRSQGGDFRV